MFLLEFHPLHVLYENDLKLTECDLEVSEFLVFDLISDVFFDYYFFYKMRFYK